MNLEPRRAAAETDVSRQPVEYARALEVQRCWVKRRQRGEIPDTLWILEHPPTITWGSSGGRGHLLVGVDELKARGVTVCPTERGGDVTCHEPGQLVGYPIVQLGAAADEDRDLHAYLRRLEEALVKFLKSHGLDGRRLAGRTGVWLPGEPPRKIAAMGVRCSRWVTSHGFALNVENDLEGFRAIVPCGIRDAAVTSVEREIAPAPVPRWDDLCRNIHRALEEALERPLRLVRGAEVFR